MKSFVFVPYSFYRVVVFGFLITSTIKISTIEFFGRTVQGVLIKVPY